MGSPAAHCLARSALSSCRDRFCGGPGTHAAQDRLSSLHTAQRARAPSHRPQGGPWSPCPQHPPESREGPLCPASSGPPLTTRREPSRAGQGGGTLGDIGALLRHPQEVGATGEPGLSGSGSRLVPALLSPAATLCSHPGGPCELERPRQFPVCAGYFWKWLSDLFLSQAPDRRSRHGPRHLLQRGLCKAQGPCASQGWGWQSATPLDMKTSLKPGRRKALVSCWGRLTDTELWPGEAVACLSRLAF